MKVGEDAERAGISGGKRMNNSLTPKRRRFVDEYLVDLNATQAAIRAGYSPKTARSAGSRLLTNVNIKPVIQAAMDARAKRLEISADNVLKELARIGFADIRDLVAWDEEHVRFRPSGQLTDDQAAAISEVLAETKRFTDNQGNTETTIKLKLKTHDKLAALRDIGRHLKLFTDQVEHQVTGGVLVVPLAPTEEEWSKGARDHQNRLTASASGNGNRDG